MAGDGSPSLRGELAPGPARWSGRSIHSTPAGSVCSGAA